MAKQVLKFPEGFLWGSATAAHQVEGNNIHNDWWQFEQSGNIQGKETSGIAVDHYNRFEEDFDIAKSLNQNAHRFSIEWSRIEPKEGEFNMDEIKHYAKVIQALKKRGMKVMVVLFHFTLPAWFAKKGGWECKGAVKYFIEYVEYVARYLGGDIDYWLTINEVENYLFQGYVFGHLPPQVKNFLRFLKVQKVLEQVHKESYFTIHRFFKDAQVGFSQNMPYTQPFNSKSFMDKKATDIVYWLSNDGFLKNVKDTLDFFGLQYYNRAKIKFVLGGKVLSLAEEYGIEKHIDQQAMKNDMGWEICAEGIYHILKRLKKYNFPIIVTENGIADREDKLRKQFIHDHLYWIHRAIQEGIDVRGYFYWTLMDNFEWIFGRWPRFGLVEIDYEHDLKRKIRPSAYYFAEICKTNTLVINDQ